MRSRIVAKHVLNWLLLSGHLADLHSVHEVARGQLGVPGRQLVYHVQSVSELLRVIVH